MTLTNGSSEKEGLLKGWHLDKRFHLGNIATIVLLAISGTVFVLNTDNKADDALQRSERNKAYLERRITQERADRREADARIINRMKRNNRQIGKQLESIQDALVRIEEKMYKERQKK